MGWEFRVLIGGLLLAGQVSVAQAMSLRDAVQITVRQHPSVAAARADRRATGYELRQAQGRLLPQVNVIADVGYQKIDQPQGKSPDVNNKWRMREEATVTVQQILFDFWDRANDIYRNAARIDASAFRVMERSEALGLRAVEAYIDVRRHSRLLDIARDNVRRHQQILELVKGRRQGGKASQGEVDQAAQRVEATKAVVAEIKQSLLESQGRFRNVIGREPGPLQPIYLPRGLPGTRAAAVRMASSGNPTIKAAEADFDAAKFTREQARSGYFPQVTLEGRASFGDDVNGTPGPNEDLLGKVVVTWNLFDGLITTNRNRAAAERMAQAEAERLARIRETSEAVDRAWASYVTGGERVKSFREQVKLNRKVVASYLEEYELSKRTLLDLLDTESSLFNSRFQLESIHAVHLFSAYQVLASMGKLLESLGVVPPGETIADHRLQSQKPLGIFNISIEPLRKN